MEQTICALCGLSFEGANTDLHIYRSKHLQEEHAVVNFASLELLSKNKKIFPKVE